MNHDTYHQIEVHFPPSLTFAFPLWFFFPFVTTTRENFSFILTFSNNKTALNLIIFDSLFYYFQLIFILIFIIASDASFIVPTKCPLKFIYNMSMDDHYPLDSSGGNLTHCIMVCQMENLCLSFKADLAFNTCYFSRQRATGTRLIPANDSMVVTVDGDRRKCSKLIIV